MAAVPSRSSRHAGEPDGASQIKLARWLIANAGLRNDGYEEFQRVTPRAALIVLPSSTQSLKYLYGKAFRAPNAFELNSFFGEGVSNLRPESIDTHELVWERYVNNWLRTSVSTYWYKADRLITLMPDDLAFLGITFANPGEVRVKGPRARSADAPGARIAGVGELRSSERRVQETHERLPNSPRHIVQTRISLRGPTHRSILSVERQFLSGLRRHRDGVGPYGRDGFDASHPRHLQIHQRDVMQSARSRRETYVGPWLPEPRVGTIDIAPFGSRIANGTGRADTNEVTLVRHLLKLPSMHSLAALNHAATVAGWDRAALKRPVLAIRR